MLRKMSKLSSLLSPLFTPIMQEVLAATLLESGREWYLSDLAGHLGVTPSSLQRPLAGLAEAGVLQKGRDGNRGYYSADTSCVIFSELAGMVAKGVAGGAISTGGEMREVEEKLAVDL